MLRLLTLKDYLKVMTVDEQERIFRDGQPFTAEDIERWRALLASREQTYTEIFTKAMEYKREPAITADPPTFHF